MISQKGGGALFGRANAEHFSAVKCHCLASAGRSSVHLYGLPKLEVQVRLGILIADASTAMNGPWS